MVVENKNNKEYIAEKINFVEEEERILEYWKEINAFEESIKLSEGRKNFSFYDGPPFATGLPHYGHILAGTIKDVITRYAHQTGHYVPRRFGWDCHGLPVEHEIDKINNIKGPKDVENMGIKQYNNACRSIVSRYSSEWESVVSRFGRWIDFKNDYKTMYPWFMESVWWVFKQIYNKGLVYKSCKIMPFSTACSTPLSNFETGQNYKDIIDPSVIIKFPVVGQIDTYLLAWTTTPWTLPSNLCLIVNPDKLYVKVKDVKSLAIYILMHARLHMIYSDKNSYEIIDKFEGKTLVGIKYIPPFNYFKHFEQNGAFSVLSDPYVTDDSGTGIVHSAPAFGEDDLRVCKLNNIITRVEDLPCPVDSTGHFTEPIIDFIGEYVKDADSKIIKHLKEKKLVLVHSQHKHSYPFCWRSDTPILYKAVPSWFIKVESIIEGLLINNKKCHWVPENVRDKRFHNWLANARDWNISRNRYWGTPIPLWVSDDGEEVICVGSIEELFILSGVRVTDLHRENIDDIVIPSKMGKGNLKRTSEVFDCWFESGSMPYAQIHYPFENKELFHKTFPADFVAEGIDQTRGWFYTLLVISTAIFNEPPFKNLVVNGLVLASDGQKMSKRKKNYPDPMEMVKKYGADCVRCYLINSPVVYGENLCFKESGLLDLIKEFFLPWFNANRYFLQNKCIYEKKVGKKFIFDRNVFSSLDSCILDRWILSTTQSLIINYKSEMERYFLSNLFPHLQKQIDNITKWYIRLNRLNLRGDNGVEKQFISLNVFYYSLYKLCHICAQLCPFICEYYFQILKQYLQDSSDVSFKSIHFRMIPNAEDNLIDKEVEKSFENFTCVVDVARRIREKNNCAMKHPLLELVVLHPSSEYLESVSKLDIFIREDLNVKNIVYSTNQAKYGLSLSIEPNYALLGKRLKSNMKNVVKEINEFSQEQLLKCIQNEKINIQDYIITLDEVNILYRMNNSSSVTTYNQYDVGASKQLAILLDIKPDSTLKSEGIARDFINRLQKLRKKANVLPTDDIIITYNITNDCNNSLSEVISNHKDLINSIIKIPLYTDCEHTQNNMDPILKDSFEVAECTIFVTLYK